MNEPKQFVQRITTANSNIIYLKEAMQKWPQHSKSYKKEMENQELIKQRVILKCRDIKN